MSVLLTFVTIVVVLFVLILLYLTFVPIVATIRADACETSAELVWGIIGLRFLMEGARRRLELRLFGLPIRLPFPKKAEPGPETTGEPSAGEERRAPATRTAGQGLEVMGILLRAWPDIQRLLVAVLRETRVRLRLGLVFGSGDAAATGEAFGTLMAIRGALSAQPWLRLTATPVFDGPTFEWVADGEVRVRSPIRVMLPAFRLFLRPEIRHLMTGGRR
jgi:hypothetical protein